VEDEREQLRRLIEEAQARLEALEEGTGDITADEIQADNIVTGVQINHIVNNYLSGPHRATKEEFERGLTAYLHWLVDSYGKIVLRGLRQTGEQPPTLDLDDIYVPLEAEQVLPGRAKVKAEAGLMEAERPVAAPLNLKDLLTIEGGERIVVIGGPGCGKSTVLQHIAWTLAYALLHGDADFAHQRAGLRPPLPLPILVPLHAFAEHRGRHQDADDPQRPTLAYFISDYLIRHKEAPNLPADFFRELLSRDRTCLVMLDGIDEVASEAQRKKICRAVESLAGWTQGNRYLVTSRPAAYSGDVYLRGFRRVNVLPLEPPQVEALLRKLYAQVLPETHRASRLNNLLESLRRLEKEQAAHSRDGERLIASPLMVRMVAVIDLSGNRLPERRAELYDQFVDALLHAAYHLDWLVGEKLAVLGGDPVSRREWLSLLAFAMHTQAGDVRYLPESEVCRLLQDHLEPRYGEQAREKTGAFVRVSRERGGLVEVRAADPSDRWSFSHFTFQEFR
jgi:predicted NACHT family NTPase